MPKKSEHALALFHAHVGIEIWKHVHDFPFVEVSNLGRVRRWWKSIGYRIINGRDMKGYLSIRINDKNFFIHRLVAKTFIPNPYNKKSVDHVVSSEKCNNKLTNLRWATPKEQNYNRKTCSEILGPVILYSVQLIKFHTVLITTKEKHKILHCCTILPSVHPPNCPSQALRR